MSLQLLGCESAELLVAVGLPGRPDHFETAREPIDGEEPGESGEEETAGQIAGCPDENESFDGLVAHPANSRTGWPLTPTSAMNSDPAAGSASRSKPSRDVVM